MICVHVCTDAWVNARRTTTRGFGFRAFTAKAIHVCCRATKVRDYTCKAWHCIAYLLNLSNDRVFRTALNNTPFVFGNRTECTAAITPTHNVNTKTYHVVRRYFCIAIYRVWNTLIRQVEHRIHLFCFKRHSGWINPNVSVAVTLH